VTNQAADKPGDKHMRIVHDKNLRTKRWWTNRDRWSDNDGQAGAAGD